MAETDIRPLLVSESWVFSSTHFKGWDFFSSAVYEAGSEHLEKALAGGYMSFAGIYGAAR
ncbi:MAG: glutamine amidotransferase [Aggregatilineales bacterium]